MRKIIQDKELWSFIAFIGYRKAFSNILLFSFAVKYMKNAIRRKLRNA